MRKPVGNMVGGLEDQGKKARLEVVDFWERDVEALHSTGGCSWVNTG